MKNVSFKGNWDAASQGNIEELFLRECHHICNNKASFLNFKRNFIFTKVIGNDVRSKDISDVFYGYIESTDLIKDIQRYKKNDLIGNPVLYEYEKTGPVSPGTLCFMSILNDVNTRLVDVSNKSVCEIGSGYGGQAKILLDYGVKSIDLIDRPETLGLAKTYLSLFKHPNVSFHTVDAVPVKEYDLCISNWCLSELDYEGMNFYLDNVVSKSEAGYFLTNFRDDEKQKWLLTKLEEIFEDVSIEPEIPRTNENDNFVFLCKNRKE